MDPTVKVEVIDEAKADVEAIEDVEVKREAIRLALRLREEPYLGEKLRHKANQKPLSEADCRKVKFDLPDRPADAEPRYRFRLVYRIEPHDGSPARIVVMAVGVKPQIYGDATARAAKRLREQIPRLTRRSSR